MPNPKNFKRVMSMMGPSAERNIMQEAAAMKKAQQLETLGIGGAAPSMEQTAAREIQPIISGAERQAKIEAILQKREAARQANQAALENLPASAPRMSSEQLGSQLDDATKAGLSSRDDLNTAFKQQAYESSLRQEKAKAEALERMKKSRFEE